MIKGKHHCLLQLDPRTKILLLLVANILLFFGSSSEVTYIYMAVLAMVLLLSGCYKSLLAFGVIGTLFISINYWIFPIAPKVFTMIFSISVNYTLKISLLDVRCLADFHNIIARCCIGNEKMPFSTKVDYHSFRDDTLFPGNF